MLYSRSKFLYLISSFLAGFSIMVVELISSRIVAPIIGASVFTWTSVIGLTLLGLAIGGWVGGKIADEITKYPPLSFAFFFSAFFVSIIPILAQHTKFITSASTSILQLNLLVSIYLFFIPASCIGTIQPLILKKFANEFSQIGSTYGTLSAAWSIGSLLGVFLTGFFFISTIGSAETIWFVSCILFFLGTIYAFPNKKLCIFFISLFFVVILLYSSTQTSNANILFEKETDYYSVKVIDANIPNYGQSRLLFLDFDIHSFEPLEHRLSYVQNYTDISPIFSYFKKDLQDILVLGAGAYTLPKKLKKFYTDSNVVVVETDPSLIEIGEKFFNVPTHEIKTVINDAKLFITQDEASYDLIFGDTYNSYISVPWYLLTREWNNSIQKKLNPGGIYAINFIGSFSGEGSAFTGSIVHTFKKTFPNYYIVSFSQNKSNIQNIVLIGINGDTPFDEEMLITKLRLDGYTKIASFITSKQSVQEVGSVILTDDFSPTEKLMSPIISKYFPENKRLTEDILSK